MRRLDIPVRRRIFEALDLYVTGRRGDAQKLTGRGDQWRLRVGNWRVIFRPDFQDGVVVVLRVLPRSQAYRA